jgi:hypothetical protein
MAPLPSQRRQDRARIAAATRWHPDDPGLADLRRAVRQARGEEDIGRLLDLPLEWRARQAARLLATGSAS